MVDAKISALTAVVTPLGTDELAINQSGTSKKITLAQLDAATGGLTQTNTGAVTGYAADTYLQGSGFTITPARLRAGTIYRCRFDVVKTAAGVAAPVLTLRAGTTGSTTDAAAATLTFAAQTGVIDEGEFLVEATFRAVGASAQVQAKGTLFHRLVTTGLNVTATYTKVLNLGSTFSSTAVTRVGLSINGGTSASWTTTEVVSELIGLST
jgi:hypothetical protein